MASSRSQPDTILKRHIRPAFEKLGVKKKIGWNSFRYGLSNLLRELGLDVKVTQELLRHANSRVTLDVYQRTVTEERRVAQELAFNWLLGGESLNILKHPNTEQKEEVMLASA